MKNMKCPKCGYEWKTKSIKMFITCPNCQTKSRREPKEVKEEKEED